MELPAYDPRGMQGQGLLFATSNRGGCHMRGNMLGLEVLGLPKLIDRFQVRAKPATSSCTRTPPPWLTAWWCANLPTWAWPRNTLPACCRPSPA